MRTMTLALAATVVALAGCGWSDSDTQSREELVLRGYDAPGQAESLATAIGSLLRLGDDRVGSARVGAGDQVLVLAPRSVHEDLEAVVRDHVEAGEATAAPASISMTYWFVGARPVADPLPVPPNLSEVGTALEEVVGVQGPHEFRLIERVQLRQSPRHDEGGSEARSPTVSLLQVLTYSRGEVVAFIRAVPAGQNQIKTTVRLRPDQLLVLGQVGLDAALDPFRSESAGHTGGGAAYERALYLIIRADVDPPA